MNKKMQTLIGKETTFPEGIDALIELRESLFEQITSIAKNYPAEAFYQMPFAGAEGYHSKTLVYSMWHIFRIEDIVAHELIGKDYCGSCRTPYNTCSYATCSPDGVCPNAACCKEKGLDGCYECDDIRECKRGFYSLGKEVHAIKSMSLFISRHGKRELQTVLENLHKKQVFEKVQEVLGDNIDQGLQILEENR